MACTVSAAVQPNASQILKGKNPLPVIDRECDPLNQVTQRSAVLELLLASISGKPWAASDTEGNLRDLVSRNSRLFSNQAAVSAALTVRNNLTHARGHFVSMQEKMQAARSLAEAINDVLPQVPAELRDAVLGDPHQQSDSESLAQIRTSDSSVAAKMPKLARRLDALLAACDASERRPGYDLAPGQLAPTLAQRLKQNSRYFSPSEACELVNVARIAEEVGAYTEQKIRHMERKLCSANRTLEAAVRKLEIELGISQPDPEPEPASQAGEPLASSGEDGEATAEAPALHFIQEAPETPPSLSSERPATVAVSLAPLVEAVSASITDSAQPGLRVRVSFNARAAKAFRWLLAAAATAMIVTALGCAFISTHADDTVRTAQVSAGQPSIVYWTAPEMTPMALRAGVRGTLNLRIWVNRRGVPEKIEVVGRLGHGLETMAVTAAAHWRFTPSSRVENDPVVVPVEFDSNTESSDRR